MIIKHIHSQDAHYKFSPKKSGETSLNLSNEIFQLIAPELPKGEEKPVSFILFRTDYLKALSVIISHTPLYVTTSTTATEVTSDPSVFIKDFQSICTFFGPNERNTYTVNLLYRSDGRIYLNSLEDKNSKFNLRHFLVEETSSLEFEKTGDDISIRLKFDSTPQNKKESTPQLIVSNKKLTSFVLSSIRHFNKIDKLDSIVPFTSPTSPIKVSKTNLFSLTGMFLESTIDDVKERNSDHIRWFEDAFKLGERNVFLSTQWNSQGDYQLTLDDLIKMIQTCYGEEYFYKTGPNGEHQLYYNDTNHQQTAMGIEKILPYLTALRTKPFMLLAGISGTGKSRIVREMAKACWKEGDEEYGKNNPKNFCMVQVKPNWHDSTELMGYVTRISGKPEYVAGDFIKFIVKAWYNEDTPFFLCLDEMNLAPVEQYFAEYLSVIESRKMKLDGMIATDPILKASYHRKDDGTKEPDEWFVKLIDNLLVECPNEKLFAVRKQFLEEGIAIPQNLFVVGTVNMDETTFSFSRKVLDRAMTIEMNEVDLHGGLEKGAGNDIGYIGNSIIGDAAEGCDVYEDNHELCDQVLAYLEQVNAILEGTPFKIAYRTRNEFLMYAVNRKKLDEKSQLWQSLDEMTSMKILSRIEGDEERTKKVLDGLKTLVEEQITVLIPAAEEGKSATQSISATKIDEMLAKLKATGFTSYWA